MVTFFYGIGTCTDYVTNSLYVYMFQDLDIYRIKTLVSLLEWDENFVKQHIAAGSSNLGE